MFEVLKNLAKFKKLLRISVISFVLIKIVFILCYTGANLFTIYNHSEEENQTFQKVFKTGLVSINIPCNIVLSVMFVYFY